MTAKEFEIQQALGSLSYDQKKKLAKNSNTFKGVLTLLSKDKNAFVRYCVAKNSNTSKEVLDKLSKDEVGYVKLSAIYNPNGPKEIRMIINND